MVQEFFEKKKEKKKDKFRAGLGFVKMGLLTAILTEVVQDDTKKAGTFEMRSGSHVQLAALRNRDLELQTTSPFSNNGSVERSTACCRHTFLQFLLGFSKVHFFVSPCTMTVHSVYVTNFSCTFWCLKSWLDNCCKKTNKCIKELVDFVNVFQILPRHVRASGCHLQGVVGAL
jgi:hypothetical protein